MAMNPEKTRLASGQKNHMGYIADVIVWDITVRRRRRRGGWLRAVSDVYGYRMLLVLVSQWFRCARRHG